MRFLGYPLPRISSFLGSLFLAHIAWRLAAKNYFLGGFSIFLGGFWPPRQFQILVVIATTITIHGTVDIIISESTSPIIISNPIIIADTIIISTTIKI